MASVRFAAGLATGGSYARHVRRESTGRLRRWLRVRVIDKISELTGREVGECYDYCPLEYHDIPVDGYTLYCANDDCERCLEQELDENP